MELNEALVALRSAVDNGQIPDKDRDFASSLLSAAASRGLSVRQTPWVFSLVERAMRALNPPPATEVGDFKGVYSLLSDARKHLRYPKIRLQTPSGEPVVLGLSGARSSRPDTVNVTDGGPYGYNKWYGRVRADGGWEKSEQVHADTEQEVAALLARLAKEPAKVAAEYGKLTGNCCFCNRQLEDARSTDVGYGPVCAKNYGLPWGR